MHHSHDDLGLDLSLTESVTEERAWRPSEILTFSLAGLLLGAAVAFSGHYFATHANARAVDDGQWLRLATPAPLPMVAPPRMSAPLKSDMAETVREAALLSAAEADNGPDAEKAGQQRVARAGKGDRQDIATIRLISVGDVAMAAAGVLGFGAGSTGETFRDAAGLARKDDAARAVRRLLVNTPPIAKLEEAWRLGRETRRRILAQRRFRQRELACLARAIYFEARSEGIRGQMAVAKVILNRVKDPRFPNTICGVVYQGAEKRNACQFSFACDGRPDVPRQRKAWAQARRIAAKAMKGRISMPALAGVTYYHADYVRPKWSYSMRRVVRIGRHIFYRDG
ncbi:cell wall hydrolase [Thermopetrobacter sp. TC1]|uniref:cell wall hydrolase n=1 Tax=Thermopetrobacter sp. TC1 TaxID=1495045 RepID=UPI000690DDF2|nr:cell wall hydrolase [Thermopetrobacter sp. TC1]